MGRVWCRPDVANYILYCDLVPADFTLRRLLGVLVGTVNLIDPAVVCENTRSTRATWRGEKRGDSSWAALGEPNAQLYNADTVIGRAPNGHRRCQSTITCARSGACGRAAGRRRRRARHCTYSCGRQGPCIRGSSEETSRSGRDRW